jgi:hypothetical protein
MVYNSTQEDTRVMVAKSLEVTEKNLAVTQQVEEGYAKFAQLFVYLTLIAFPHMLTNSRGQT